MQQERPQQKQRQRRAPLQSATTPTAGVDYEEEASTKPKHLQQPEQQQEQQQEEEQRAAEDAALQGDHLAQATRSHAALQRLCVRGVGRQPCDSCNVASATCLHWDLGRQCRRTHAPLLDAKEQGRLLPKAFYHMAPPAQSLYDMAGAGRGLAFPGDDASYEMASLATEFLLELCDSELSRRLPLLFGDASVKPVGSWTQETALPSRRPCLDFVLSLPAWISANKLCVCEYSGLRGTVALASSQRLPFETQLHQALICSVERLVAGAAVAKLQQQEADDSGVVLDYERGISYSPGADSQFFWTPKRLVLHVVCRTQAGGERPCSLRLFFGVPCLVDTSVGEDAEENDERQRKLFGHLLLGLSQPIMLSLALEEKKRLLSGAESSDHPRLRLVRVAKFLMQVGQQLALFKEEIERPDTQLSFHVNTTVRETQRKYEAVEEAYYRANFADRLKEVLDDLAEGGTRQYFGAECAFTTVRRRKPPPTTLRLLDFAVRQDAKQTDVERLMPLLLEVHDSWEDGADKQALVDDIDRILGQKDS